MGVKSRNWCWGERQVEKDFPRNFLKVSEAMKILYFTVKTISIGKFGS